MHEKALLQQKGKNLMSPTQVDLADKSWLELATLGYRDTTDFLYNWLKNNKSNCQPTSQVSHNIYPPCGGF
jgi:hypothetical protein